MDSPLPERKRNPGEMFFKKFHSLGIQSPCQMMIGVYNHLLSKVFRFHYHSQEVIGLVGIDFFGNVHSGKSNIAGWKMDPE